MIVIRTQRDYNRKHTHFHKVSAPEWGYFKKISHRQNGESNLKPVIAVSSYIADKDVFYGYGTSGDYIKAIDGAGGIPVQLPTIKKHIGL